MMTAKVPSARLRFLDETQMIANDAGSQGPEVIAAGLWRCATSSLQMAFEQVLDPPLAPSMHGAYLMPHPDRIKLLNKATHEPDKQKRQAMLREIYTGYNASSDWPGFVFLNDLLDMYPDCKVILNKRITAQVSSSTHVSQFSRTPAFLHPPKDWVASTTTTLAFFSTRTYALLTYLLPISRAHYDLYRSFMRLAVKRYGVPATTKGIFSAELYRRHNQWVHVTCAARGKEVLEWEPEDGWEPLCRFLGRKVPECEFPRTNEGEEIKKLTKVLIRQGLMAWARLVGKVGLAVGLALLIWRWRRI